VHSLENELADNSSDVADATMPLSLEIEKLQQLLKSKAQTSDRRESNLQSKVTELESKLKSYVEAEKTFRSSQSVLQNSVLNLEQQNEKLVEEKSALSSQLAAENTLKAEHLRKLSNLHSLESKIQEVTTEVSSLRTENETLQTELRNERNSLQAETKRSQALTEQLKLSNSHSAERVSFSSASGTKQEESRNTSPRSVMSEASYLDDVLDPNGQNHCLTPKSFFDSFSSVNYIENLQGHLRQKELELVQLHQEVIKNEKIRKSLNDEIAHLTVNNQELLQRVERLGGLQQQLSEVEKNYNAVLQVS
jgi:chromosome segregation ATPase